MKSIKEKAEEYSSGYMNLDRQQVAKQALEYGADYVLEQIENFMKDLDLGNSAEEKFYKLDVLADIHGFIDKLNKK